MNTYFLNIYYTKLNAEDAKETKYRRGPALAELIIWMGREILTEKSNDMLNYSSGENWHNVLWDEEHG